MTRSYIVSAILGAAAVCGGAAWGEVRHDAPLMLVQIPYEAPPKSQDIPDVSVPPNTKPLSPEEVTRAEALL